MDKSVVADLQRQLDATDPRLLEQLPGYVRALPAERKAHLERLAAHLSTRLGRADQPFSGAVIHTSHFDGAGRHTGFDLQVIGRPDLSGFVSLLDWAYVGRQAVGIAIRDAQVHTGAGFGVTAEIRAMRDGVEPPPLARATTGTAAPRASDLEERLARVIEEATAATERDAFWRRYTDAMNRLRADPIAWAAYQAESRELEGTLMDGLDPDEDWSSLAKDAQAGQVSFEELDETGESGEGATGDGDRAR